MYHNYPKKKKREKKKEKYGCWSFELSISWVEYLKMMATGCGPYEVQAWGGLDGYDSWTELLLDMNGPFQTRTTPPATDLSELLNLSIFPTIFFFTFASSLISLFLSDNTWPPHSRFMPIAEAQPLVFVHLMDPALRMGLNLLQPYQLELSTN